MPRASSRVLEFASRRCWAIEPDFFRQMTAVLAGRAEGIKLSDSEIAAAIGRPLGGDKPESSMQVNRGTAVIRIHGVIAQRASAVHNISIGAGTSVEHIRADLQRALRDPKVHAIVLDIDSPGGAVDGITELAEDLRRARDRKPIVAHTDSLMASAAYWLAAQANRVVATRSSRVGSVGVIASFLDDHRALSNRGYDEFVVKSTPGKSMRQATGTISEQSVSDLQREIDTFHAMFVADIAAGREITAEAAAAMGDGRVRLADEALSEGFIDEVGGLADAIASVSVRGGRGGRAGSRTTAASNTNHRHQEPMTQRHESPAASDERDRASAILEAAADCQVALATELIRNGTDLDEALKAITADAKRRIERQAPAANEPIGLGNSSEVLPRGPSSTDAMPAGPGKWDAEWNSDPDLRAEFGNDKESYFAFMKAGEAGQIVLTRSRPADAEPF